jgi:hypothetical protein
MVCNFYYYYFFNFIIIFFVFLDLSQRVDHVKEESFKLRQENQVLGQYIQNLMAASTVFQTANQPSSKNGPGSVWDGLDFN